MKPIRIVALFGSVALVAAVALGTPGCSSTPSTGDAGGVGGTPYSGVFTGAKESGVIDVVVSSGGAQTKDIRLQSLLQVTGSIRLVGGMTINVTGTYDDVTKQLTLSGGGYSFTGTGASDGVNGTYMGPNGSGVFTVLTGQTVTVYCGSYAGDAMGSWNFVVSGSSLSGSAVDSGGGGDTFTGTVNGGMVSITSKAMSTASGTISGNTATGTWQSAGGKKGTWTGTAGCK